MSSRLLQRLIPLLRIAIAVLLVSSTGSAFAGTGIPQPVWGVVATDNRLSSENSENSETKVTENAASAYLSYTITEKSTDQVFHVESARSGLNRHKLTDGRSLIGWKLSETVYFGRAKKDRAAVSLVWQASTEQQVSLSTHGVKLTRHFR